MERSDIPPARRSKGSCLVQLVIIIVVMLVLAAIAIPDFLRFQAKASCSGLKTNLGAIFTAQAAYFEEHGRYAGGENCFELLEWKAFGTPAYSYYCGEDVIKNQKGYECPPQDVEHGVSESGFTIMAAGNIDSDPTCDVWTINDAKVIKNVVNDPAD